MTTRQIDFNLQIDWDFDGVYTNESVYLIQATGSMRLAAPESSISSPRGIVDDMVLTLDNHDGRFSPLNSAGALYSDIANGGAYHAPVYLTVSINGGDNYYRVFTGVIKTPIEQGPAYQDTATVLIDCRDKCEPLLTYRTNTTNTQFAAIYSQNWNEGEIIEQWLTDAGVSSGSYEIDEGLFVIPWAWLDDESPIEEIWQLAAACGGRFYADPGGVLRYENATHWLKSPHDTSQETLTESDYERIKPYYNDRELYKAVTVEMSQRDQVVEDIIWQADGEIVVPANTTKTIIAKLRQPAYTIASVSYTAVTGGGTDISDDITITITKYAQRAELSIENANTAYSANLVNLLLTGISVDGRPSQEETETSTLTGSGEFWENRQGRTKDVRSNPWVQTRSQMLMLAEFLKDRYEEPRLFYQMYGVPGDPSRRLGDRVTIDDGVIMSSSRQAFLTECRWQLNQSGFVQDLVAIDATDLFPDTSYFVIGTDTLDSTDKVFY